MGIRTITRAAHEPDLYRYDPEFNADGTEKHITCDGARFHVVSYAMTKNGPESRCSCANCELNARKPK